MANPYASTGTAAGIYSGLETARQRRIGEEARQAGKKRNDLQMEGMEFDLSRAKIGAERADESYARNMNELQKRNQEEGVSDFVRALNAGVDPNIAMERFNASGSHKLAQVQYDPNGGLLLVDDEGEQQQFESPDQFAAAMGIQPGEQPEPIKLGKDDRLVTPQGETIVDAEQPAAGENLMKVGDVLYDREKGEWITPPGEDGKDKFIKVDKQLYNTETGEWLSPPSGGGGGRDVSPFNPESTLQKIERGIVRSHGGSFDALGNYSVPGDRELVDTKVGLAGESFARLTDYVRGGDISYSEVEAAVIRATKGLEAASDIEKQAEKWRTDGWNKSHEEKQHWMSAERERQMADARARLMREEQKMLERAGKKRAQREEQQGDEGPVGRPEWAGQEIPAEALGGAQLEYGIEYDVQAEDGSQMTIRLGPDGKVYAVEPQGGSAAPPAESGAAPAEPPPAAEPRAAAPPAPAEDAEPESPLAGAREASAERGGYGIGEPGFADEIQLLGDLYRTKPWIRSPAARERMGLPSRQSVAVAQRARSALDSDRSVSKSDAQVLAELDDQSLLKLGLNAEQIVEIRELVAADSTLAQARREQPEFQY